MKKCRITLLYVVYYEEMSAKVHFYDLIVLPFKWFQCLIFMQYCLSEILYRLVLQLLYLKNSADIYKGLFIVMT